MCVGTKQASILTFISQKRGRGGKSDLITIGNLQNQLQAIVWQYLMPHLWLRVSQLLEVRTRMDLGQLCSLLLLLVELRAAEKREGKTRFLDQTKWPTLASLAATVLGFLHDVTTSFRTPVSWFNHSGHLDFCGWTKNRCWARAISLALYFPGSNRPAVLWKMTFLFLWLFVKNNWASAKNQTKTNQTKKPEKLLCFVYTEFKDIQSSKKLGGRQSR